MAAHLHRAAPPGATPSAPRRSSANEMVNTRFLMFGVAALVLVTVGWSVSNRSAAAGGTVVDGRGGLGDGSGGGPNNVVGGVKPVAAPESVPAVVAAAAQAVAAWNGGKEAAGVAHGVVRIVSATTQVVAGVKYGLELEVAPVSACPGGDLASAKCTFDASRTMVLSVSVWHRAWLHDKDPANEWVVTVAAATAKSAA